MLRKSSGAGRLFAGAAIALGLAVAPSFASTAGLSYTCDPSISTDVCSTIQNTIAGLYNSTFSFTNSISVYVQFNSSAGLGENVQSYVTDSYSDYRSRLISHEGDANDVTAVATLPNQTNNPLSADGAVSSNPLNSGAPSTSVMLTTALASALGLTPPAFSGVASVANSTDVTSCTLSQSNPNCYNDVISINPSQLYFRTGTQTSDQYDFYSILEHETDEALGTSSCLAVSLKSANTPSIDPGCGGFYNSANPANSTPGQNSTAADLFRYSGAGTRSFLGSGGNQANGSTAYFSINGGVTPIAYYNNVTNGADYGDWSGLPGNDPFSQYCKYIQDAYGCLGSGGNMDITNDGSAHGNGPEVALLDAVGYNLQPVTTTPEPGSTFLLTSGLVTLFFVQKRRLKQKRAPINS